MSNYELESVPKDHNTFQGTLDYQLTKVDIIKLYVFMSPEEILKTFRSNHCCSVATMYKIVRTYGMESRKTYNDVLKQCLLHYCPDDTPLEEFEKDVENWIAIAKAELIAEIRQKISNQCALWDPEL